MKKRKYLMFIVFSTVFLQGPGISAATNDGQLVLDPNIITNSGGGIGTTGDFPVRNQLFTPELDQLASLQREDQIPEQQKRLNFTEQAVLYDTDMTKVTKTLFTADYQPLVIKTGTGEGKRSNALWYGLIIVVGAILTVLAVILGRWRAKRRVRRKR
ncbi:type VII secretion protein EssA [Lactovum odontotermitis]